MIELNLTYPGIIIPQICTGPIFGIRTDEVIDFVRKNPAKTVLVL